MPIVTVQGPGGEVDMFSGLNAKIAAWSATMIVDVVDTSGFVDVGDHTHEPTAKMMTGSAVGTGLCGDSAAATPIPASVFGAAPNIPGFKGTLTLWASGGESVGTPQCTYSFTAVITTIPLGRVFNGKLDTVYNFVSSGVISQVWN